MKRKEPFKADIIPLDMRMAQLQADHALARAGMIPDIYSPLSTIPETVGIGPNGVRLPSQNPVTDLMFLRQQFPFLEVMPLPDRVVSIALQANVAQIVAIPDGAILGEFRGGTVDYYVSRTGIAAIPTTTTTIGANSNADDRADAVLRPEGRLWYLRGRRDVSMIAAQNTIVTLSLWMAENWPRA